jgi:hypothetical protein
VATAWLLVLLEQLPESEQRVLLQVAERFARAARRESSPDEGISAMIRCAPSEIGTLGSSPGINGERNQGITREAYTPESEVSADGLRVIAP